MFVSIEGITLVFTSIYMFLNASKALDRIDYGKYFVKLQKGGVSTYLIRILHFGIKLCELDGVGVHAPFLL